jgi:hypothetical protein
MRTRSAILPALSVLTLAACSTISVESQSRLSQPTPTLSRTLVVVALPAAARRAAEDTLVARLASLHPVASYPSVALEDDVTLGALRDRARADGFSGLLVVWPDGMSEKVYPVLGGDTPPFGVNASNQMTVRLVASLTVLDGDREVWKGIVTNRDAYPVDRQTPGMMIALADRLRTDGVAGVSASSGEGSSP